MSDELVLRSRDGTELSANHMGSGSPLVLMHGSIVTQETLALVAPLLAEKHRVWSYHRRGHGDSGDGADGSLEREVEDLAAVTAAAGPEVHLVGHSYGAVVCLKPAAHKPGLAPWCCTSRRSTPTRNWMRLGAAGSC